MLLLRLPCPRVMEPMLLSYLVLRQSSDEEEGYFDGDS